MSKKGKQTNKKTKKKVDFKRVLKYEIIALALMTLSIIAFAKLGVVGTAVVSFFRLFLGEWYYIGLVGLFLFSGYLMWKRQIPKFFHVKMIGIYLIVIAILLFSHARLFDALVLLQANASDNLQVISKTWSIYAAELKGEAAKQGLGGGMLGALVFSMFYYLFASLGAKIISVIMILIGIILFTGKSLGSAVETGVKKTVPVFKKRQLAWKEKRTEQGVRREEKRQKEANEVGQQAADLEEEDDQGPLVIRQARAKEVNVHTATEQTKEKAETSHPQVASFTEKVKTKETLMLGVKTEDLNQVGPIVAYEEVDDSAYELPPIDLLKHPYNVDQSGEYKLIHENAAKLERTFQSFGVKAKVKQVHLGPAVTKYEVHPDPGVKVSKIVSLNDDLALALAAKDIRIEAPIPGKSAVGIEVPNSEVAMVSLKEVLDSKQNDHPDEKLLVGLGRDVTGNAIMSLLNKMPHLLIAGATGSGKSVCINGIITSILMRTKPHEVKMMMIDPKMVELNVYNGVPHLLAPVVTDPRKAAQALQKVVSEMERRYEQFSHTGTRNIEGYNTYIKQKNKEENEKQPLLPYIVVIVDELADLMMVASSDVEDAIMRLAQMARAAGIHLIIATQRPSVDVITGIIKANIPSRIAFAVSSQIDSRTILDMGGAEKLLGRGDMLFLPVGASKPIRVQGAYVSDEEVEAVVAFVSDQQKVQYEEEMIPSDVDVAETFADVEDVLFDDAVQLIIEMQTASVSMLQRRFRVGYTRAARLIDAMEDRGIVGPHEGSKPRTVLIPKRPDDASDE